jgi:hypothetical protein
MELPQADGIAVWWFWRPGAGQLGLAAARKGHACHGSQSSTTKSQKGGRAMRTAGRGGLGGLQSALGLRKLTFLPDVM